MLSYAVVFEILKEPDPARPLIVGALIAAVLIAASIGLWLKRYPSELVRKTRFYPALTGSALLLLVTAMYEQKKSVDSLVEVVRTGNVHVVEGAVENF